MEVDRQTRATRYPKRMGEICDFVLQKNENFPSKSIEAVLSYGKGKNSLVLIGMPCRIFHVLPRKQIKLVSPFWDLEWR